MPQNHTLVIVNPNAGSADALAEMRERLEQVPGVTFCETQEPGDARRLAEQAIADNIHTVIAAGGDGTINEVVNGLSQNFNAARLGILPLGTGNDFGRSIYLSDDRQEMLSTLIRAYTRPLDVVRMTAADGSVRHFLNASGGGFSAQLSRDLHDSNIKKLLGSLSYVVQGAASLPQMETYHAEITLDDSETLNVDLANLVVSNGRFIGGGLFAAPKAMLDDGLLHLLIVPAMPVTTILSHFTMLMDGSHVDSEDLIVREARRIVIRSQPPMPYNADGELMPEGDYTFEVLPGALHVIVDEHAQAVQPLKPSVEEKLPPEVIGTTPPEEYPETGSGF